MKSKYRKTNVDICNAKSMWEFLHNHFRYYTLNSWNELESVANNVKAYNLGLDGDCWKALERLESTYYAEVNCLIEDWSFNHSGYAIGFNGRSGGYLVLYKEGSTRNVLPYYIAECDYETFKRYCRDYYGSVKNYMNELRFYTQLVRDFDKLCDELREYVNEISLMTDEEWRDLYE